MSYPSCGIHFTFCAKLYKIGVFLISNRSWLGWAKKISYNAKPYANYVPTDLLRAFHLNSKAR